MAHERQLGSRLADGLRSIDRVRLLGPHGARPSTTAHTADGPGGGVVETLPVAAFTIEGMHHALVAARLSAEYGVAVRHGCFCAHPYVVRLLGLADRHVEAYRSEVLQGDHRHVPGAVRASAGLGTSGADIESMLAAVADLAGGAPEPAPYEQDQASGDYFPVTDQPGWSGASLEPGAACARG